MAELVVEHLKIRLGGIEILKDVSLELNRGEITALLGPSGSGKTTLLRSVAGLEQPYDGRILVGGKPVFDGAKSLNVPTEARGLGFVFQSYALWPNRTVEANVAYALKLRGVAASEQATRVAKTLDSLGLGKLGHRYPHELSGGQQQRVAIARSLVYQPTVVLLDEPLSNLDAKLREEARAFLKELIMRENLAALMVTHDQAEALAVANKILLLNGGYVEQAGTPEEMYGAPKTLFTAEFMGSNNRLNGTIKTVSGQRAALDVAGTAFDGMARCGDKPGGAEGSGVIRLEAVHLVEGAGANRMQFELVTSMFLGSHWEHVFRGHGLNVRAHHRGALQPGQHWLEFPAEQLWIF
ncbi:MAG: ABC transporter ATP-binding protein [Beijerinckiaceae bacterium]|nr:ABC transporter ATP-binding protein [Beijerinckiaceae bacterium]